MSEDLYQKAILRLAAESNGAGHLDGDACEGREANAMCGDVVDVQLRLNAARQIEAMAHDLKGCVLVQASASLLSQHAAGKKESEIAGLRVAVAAMLNGGETPGGDWRGYEVFQSAMTYRSRHSCVLLPIDALLKALQGCEPAP